MKNLNFNMNQMLTREQMKKVSGGTICGEMPCDSNSANCGNPTICACFPVIGLAFGACLELQSN